MIIWSVTGALVAVNCAPLMHVSIYLPFSVLLTFQLLNASIPSLCNVPIIQRFGGKTFYEGLG